MTTANRPTRASTTMDLPNDLRSPAVARRRVAHVLRGHGFEALLDDALLLVTELVTNAVLHAGTSLTLRIDTTDPSRVRFEVVDQSPATLPAQRSIPSHTSEHGRGLLLLNALASSWGTIYEATEKSIWFTLATDAATGSAAAKPLGGNGTATTTTTTPSPAIVGTDAPEATLLTWLLMLDAGPAARGLDTSVLLDESLQRLCDTLAVESAVLVQPDPSHPTGYRLVAQRGTGISAGEAREALEAAQRPSPSSLDAPGHVVTPIRVAGELLGVLVIVSPAPLDHAAAVALKVTADRLATLLTEQRLAATADRARRQGAFAAEASELFASTLDAEHTLNLATQLAVRGFGSWAAAWLVEDGQPALAAVTHQAEDAVPVVRAALTSAPGERLAQRLAAELATRQMVVLTRADLPPAVQLDASGEVLALALSARRRLLGVLLVGPPQAHGAEAHRQGAHEPAATAMLVDLANRAAAGVDVASLFRQQRDVASALQASLLPAELPAAGGLEFAARYVAAGETNTVGGDFYDVVRLDNGDWALIVGDVCGRGPEAAAITGLARSVLRICLRDGRSPAEAFARLNREIADLGGRGRFCTSVIAILSDTPDGTRVRVTLAGHPPPVLGRADGETYLIGAPGTPIGLRVALSFNDVEATLQPGDALVLYTDGVTERRNRRRMLGESTLVATVRDLAGRSAEEIVTALDRTVADFSQEPARDDLALLAVRCLPTRVSTAAAATGAALTSAEAPAR